MPRCLLSAAHIDDSLRGLRRAVHTCTLWLILASDGQQVLIATLRGVFFSLILFFMNTFQILTPMPTASDHTSHAEHSV